MDVYLDSLDNKFASYAKVDSPTFKEIENILKTNSCDLSKVQWPRRADGSTDYPPLPASSAVTQNTQQPADSDETAAADTAAESQNDTEKSSMPLWVWFAIGAVVIAGGVLVVLKRKF
jgi:cobalamin biosynthesis Mg chelatase CobN